MDDAARWAHLAAVLGFVGRLYAICDALAYDLGDVPVNGRVGETAEQQAAWARLWHTNMAAWKLAALESSGR